MNSAKRNEWVNFSTKITKRELNRKSGPKCQIWRKTSNWTSTSDKDQEKKLIFHGICWQMAEVKITWFTAIPTYCFSYNASEIKGFIQKENIQRNCKVLFFPQFILHSKDMVTKNYFAWRSLKKKKFEKVTVGNSLVFVGFPNVFIGKIGIKD